MHESITLVANLGRDPEMRYLPSGSAVTNFSMATNRQYTKNDGEKVKETVWWNVSVFGKQGEACNTYLKKGSKVLVTCRMNATPEGNPRIWTGNDGAPRTSYEVIAETVRFLDSRSESSSQEQPSNVTQEEDIAF